ncbi:hypothetical protein AB5I41_07385 [Sphingomonas sp. MMS24-JH45]
MNASAFTSFYRAGAALYAAFNIGGLAVGIAVFLVLGLYVRFDEFEKWLPRHDGIYVVQTVWKIWREARSTVPIRRPWAACWSR